MVKKVVKSFDIEYLQVLDESGNCDEKLMPKLTDKQIKELYEKMVLVRTYDDKAFNLQRQGRIGSYLQVKGQEASQVGSAYALTKKDWIVTMYRSMGAMITHGYPIHQIYMYYGGDERGLKCPEGINVLPISIPVGTQSPHATGIAWASKIRKTKEVTIGYMGDGATSKADFHTAMNFAGVFQVPVVLICENNQYAISTHREHQTNAETIAQKAIGYGIKGIQVDGNDVFAVYKATKQAVGNARAGKGPTFIENFTYRMCDHSTSDDAKRYRSDKEVNEWKKKDPLTRLEKYMKKKKLLTDAYKKKVQKDATDKVNKAVEKYEKFPEQKKEDIFTFMYEKIPLQLKEQMDEVGK